MDRRRFLSWLSALVTAVGLARTSRGHTRASDQDTAFDPETWLRQRGLGRLTTQTPQSDRPLAPLQAQTLDDWKAERELYEKALWELIGQWPRQRPPLEARIIDEQPADSWTRYKVSFQSLPCSAPYASQIPAWLFVPARRLRPLPAVIALHQTVPQGKDEPAGIHATLPWLRFATYYAERGYVTLAPDMIGFGERTAGGYERTGFEYADAYPILDKFHELTLLGLMLFDVTRSVDFLCTRPEVDPTRIGVVGHSLGGILVNYVLGLEPRLRAGVASCGYGIFRTDRDFPDRWAAHNSAYLPRLVLYRHDRNALPLDLLQIMALAAPRAHLIQTAMGDTIWTEPAVAHDTFVAAELRRVRALYGEAEAANFVSVQPAEGSRDKNHGWYPEAQQEADKLLDRTLRQ